MTDTPIDHVTDTAFWVANYRVEETRRPDALFRDPLAERLVKGKGEAIGRGMTDSEAVAWSVVIRTVVIDTFIAEAVGRGIDTVINLGAGLDTRPYRMDVPADLHWVEVDFPESILFKEERLAGETPRCRVSRHGVDLSDTAARQALFAQLNGEAQRALVLTEGVIPYLTREQAGALAADLHAQPHFEAWVLDRFSPLFMKYRNRTSFAKKLKNAPFRFDPENWEAFFEGNGWVRREIRYLIPEGRRVGRPPPFLRPLRTRLFLTILPRARRTAVDEMTGYALMGRR